MTKKKRKPTPDMPSDPKELARAIFRAADRKKAKQRGKDTNRSAARK